MEELRNNAHWLLRAALAGVFVFHGLGKFLDLGGFAQMMGLSFPVAALVALAEVAGGIGIVVGAFTRDIVTRLAAIAIVPVMLGAIVLVHWGQWSFMASESHPAGGMEFQVVLLLLAAYFAITGNKRQNSPPGQPLG